MNLGHGSELISCLCLSDIPHWSCSPGPSSSALPGVQSSPALRMPFPVQEDWLSPLHPVGISSLSLCSELWLPAVNILPAHTGLWQCCVPAVTAAIVLAARSCAPRACHHWTDARGRCEGEPHWALHLQPPWRPGEEFSAALHLQGGNHHTLQKVWEERALLERYNLNSGCFSGFAGRTSHPTRFWVFFH